MKNMIKIKYLIIYLYTMFTIYCLNKYRKSEVGPHNHESHTLCLVEPI